MSHLADIKSRILHDFQIHVRSKGFKSDTDFTVEERLERREWNAVPGYAFLPEFMDKHSEYIDYYVEVHEVAEDDIAECYKVHN